MLKGFIKTINGLQKICVEKESSSVLNFYATVTKKDEFDNRIETQVPTSRTSTTKQLVPASSREIENIDTVEVVKGEQKLKSKILYGMQNIKSIILNDDLQEIEEYALFNTGIKKIHFPSNLKFIRQNAVAMNKDLKEVIFTSLADKIDISPNAFVGCGDYTVMLNDYVCYTNNPLYRACKNNHMVIDSKTLYNDGNMPALESVEILDPDCKSVGIAFKNCPNLKTVKIGNQTFQIEQISGYPLIKSSETKKIHGADQAKYKYICGDQTIVTRFVDKVSFHSDRREDLAFKYFMGLLLSDSYLKLFSDVADKNPNDTVSFGPISVQEMYCLETGRNMYDKKRLTNYREWVKKEPLWLDCDKCQATDPGIYTSCMKRVGLIKESIVKDEATKTV